MSPPYPRRKPSRGEGATDPELLPSSEPKPLLGATWEEHGRDAQLVARCTINTLGIAEDCLVLVPLKYANESAPDWISRQRWTPATVRGTPIDVVDIVNFRVRRGG